MKDPKDKRLFMVLIAAIVALLLAVVGLVIVLVARPAVEQSSKQNTSADKSNMSGIDKPTAEVNEVKSSDDYQDYRKNGVDGQGIKLTSAADVDKLSIDEDLKRFLKSKVGQVVDAPGGPVTLQPVLDRVQGKYAVVSGLENAYVIIGPASGSGEIKVVAATQNIGFKCDELKAAKVPSKLVDNECYRFDGSADGGAEEYNQQ